MRNEKEEYQRRVQSFFKDGDVEELSERMMQFNTLMAYYRCAMMEIETKFNVLNEQFSLQYDRNPINGMKTRLKSLFSIREKLKGRGLTLSMETIERELNDIAGVRVICSFTDDVYLLRDSLLNQDDITLIQEKDYIKNPKANGYRSLHLIVSVPIFLSHEKRSMKVEIQLRTISMDSWASLEHQLRYKKDIEFSDEMASELLCCANLSAELDKRMDALREITKGSRL